MKNFKKREYNAHDGSFLKNHDVSKKHKAKISDYGSQSPIDRHEVKINLDRTVVEKYVNNRKSNGSISPLHRENILVQNIPRSHQNVFSDKSNVMVKLEIPDDIQIDDNLSPTESLAFHDVPVKLEDSISLLNSLDKNTFYNREYTEPLPEDFQCQDRNNFKVEAALKNEIVESEICYEENFIGQESKDALENEEIFVGQEFKHEESVPSYENVESTNQEINEDFVQKSTRSSRKKKKYLDFIDCSQRLAKKPRPCLLNKVVSPELSIQNPEACKSQTPPTPSTSKSPLRAKEEKTNQDPHHTSSPARVILPKVKYRIDYDCGYCSHKGRWRENLINHLREKHSHLLENSKKPSEKNGEHQMYHCDRCDYKGPLESLMDHLKRHHAFRNELVRCLNCDGKFNSREELQRHRVVCLLFLICPICLADVPTRRAMAFHMKLVHSEKIYVEEGGKILDVVYRYSMEGVEKTFELTPFGERYMEIRKYFLEIESELIKLYCSKCSVTSDENISRIIPRCNNCKSRLLFQCQKCKDTRLYYPHIWRHLTNKNSFCSISGHLPFMSHEESSNAVQNQASSIEPTSHDCDICDFKGTTKKKLYEHVLNVHLDDGIMENGIADRVPCRFCPITRFDTRNLSHHITSVHFDELDGRDINDFLKEAADFRRMVKEMNLEKFKNKLKNGTVKTESDYYHKGIQSMLKPMCIECKTDGTQESELCAKCQASLNFVCLKCDELFSKYSVAWDHVTRICENRSFTLAVGNGNTYKNSHPTSQEIHELFSCLECNQTFDSSDDLNQHRLGCRAGAHYTCQFCDKFSPNFQVIKNHIMTVHANQVHYKDTLDKILQQVFENKKAHTEKSVMKSVTKKTNNRFDEFYQIIRRTFSEDVKLATFYCPKCDETVYKNFKSEADTRICPKCNDGLRVSCKICNEDYFTWSSMMTHLETTKCGAVEIEKYDLDHSYFLRKLSPEVTESTLVM